MTCRGISILTAALAFAGSASGAITQLTCDAAAESPLIRSEGFAEPTGGIVLTCTGTPGGTVSASFGVIVSAPVTNRLSSSGTVDVDLSADIGGGPFAVGGAPLLIGSNNLVFQTFTFDLSASGQVNFRILKLRVAANNLSEDRPVTVTLTTSGQSRIQLRTATLQVGVARRSFASSASSTRIVCVGSPVPETLTFSGLISAGTKFVTIRVTESRPTAFETPVSGGTNGIRILVRLSGFPAAARVFVPDFIVGNSGIQQTSGGDLGVPASGGAYQVATGGSLLLARVFQADSSGALAAPVALPPVAPGTVLAFDSASEVFLRGGAGSLTYEIVDANLTGIESAHIPIFVSLPAGAAGEGTVAGAAVSLGPLSNIAQASSSAPVPRFADVTPPNDCSILQDCNASYYPRMVVEAPELKYSAFEKTPGFYSHRINVRNESGGILLWSTSISYRNGAGWLKATPNAGVNNASIQLSAAPETLAPGIYEAVFTIDGGPVAGTRSMTVLLEVKQGQGPQPPAPPAPVQPVPRFWSVGNAANPGIDVLVPGSQATIEGTLLLGAARSVTFDGVTATVLSAAANRLTIIVPEALGSRTNSVLQVVVDGLASETRIVKLASAAPAIFPGGILNQDGFQNTVSNPEQTGRVLQVFATGLPSVAFGSIAARIHDREITQPAYAGPAPGVPGAQQVNITIPDDLPAMDTDIVVCGVSLADPSQKTCSQPARATIRSAP